MGWLDGHLHAFRVRMPHKSKDMIIGIPDDDSFDLEILPGWEFPIAEYFTEPGKTAVYDSCKSFGASAAIKTSYGNQRRW